MKLRPGILLIAPPLLEDPNFWRSVVLLCAHGEEGSFGLILNRPTTLMLHEVLDISVSYPLFMGGPVQPETLHVLHRLGDAIPEAHPVGDGIYWGGDEETLLDQLRINPPKPEDMRFFLGYSGWAPGQLEEECETGGWILAPANVVNIFEDAPEQLWRTVLRRMGGAYALLANFPDDPRLN